MFVLLERPTDAAPRRRRRLRRGLDVLVAFATLGELPPEGGAAPERAPGGQPHPHRRPLRAPLRARRAGAVASAPQVCVTPVRRGRERRARALTGGR
jgi:hypothetical protein